MCFVKRREKKRALARSQAIAAIAFMKKISLYIMCGENERIGSNDLISNWKFVDVGSVDYGVCLKINFYIVLNII